jgi:hypothetical protein
MRLNIRFRCLPDIVHCYVVPVKIKLTQKSLLRRL